MPQFKICPACGRHNAAAAFDCEECQFVLDGIDPTFVDAPTPGPSLAGDAAQVSSPEKIKIDGTEILCPGDDCGQPSPAGSSQCVYCGRPLPRHRWVIEWPWGDSTPVDSVITIGREAPASPELAARLEIPHPTVSRRHAELKFRDGWLTVLDFGSMNRTFVNDCAITPGQEKELKNGDRVRFATQLLVRIRVESA